MKPHYLEKWLSVMWPSYHPGHVKPIARKKKKRKENGEKIIHLPKTKLFLDT